MARNPSTDKESRREQVSRLRDSLLAAQADARKAQTFGVAVIVTGIPTAGRSETVNRLLEWLDPKYVAVSAAGAPSAEATVRPPMWRYWRALPAHGRIGIYFDGWYGDYLACMLHGARQAKRQGQRMLERIRQLETMLRAERVRIVKIHFDIDARTQRQRLAELRANKLTRWRVTQEDLWFARRHRWVRRVIERCLAASNHPAARWHVIDGREDRARELRVGEILRDELLAGLHSTPGRLHPRAPAQAPSPLPQARQTKVARETYKRELERLQGRLAALTRRAAFRARGLLLVFEGMDAAGKGGAIRRITQALDARQYQVIPVSAPTPEERAHPYLWRFWHAVPQRGQIAIFDRSWYGRVLVERVRGFTPSQDWQRAYDEIPEFERQLTESGLVVAKFWLQVSKREQLRRLQAREEDPLKRFKIDPEDWINRRFYDAYQTAAAEMIVRTDASDARWTVVAADDKKCARLQVLKVTCDTIEAQLK